MFLLDQNLAFRRVLSQSRDPNPPAQSATDMLAHRLDAL